MALEELDPHSCERDEFWVKEIAQERPKLTPRPRCRVYYDGEHQYYEPEE